MKTAPPRTLEEAGEDVHRTWPDARDAEYMAQLWGKYIVDRSEAVARSGGKGVHGEFVFYFCVVLTVCGW